MATDGGRREIVEALQSELMGPSFLDISATKGAKRIDSNSRNVFANWDEARGPFVDLLTGEEILDRDVPTQRYGVGVLYPKAIKMDDEAAPVLGEEIISSDTSDSTDIPNIDDHFGAGDAESDDFELSATSQFKPSAMAISFLCELEDDDQVQVEMSGACYKPFEVQIDRKTRQFWVRRKIFWKAKFNCSDFADGRLTRLSSTREDIEEPIKLEFQILTRLREKDQWLMTVALVNLADSTDDREINCVFQTRFNAVVLRKGECIAAIIPYPDKKSEMLLFNDSEARSLDLLYQQAPVFAIGHGCAATWNEKWGANRSLGVCADPFPIFEAPSVTPNVILDDGSELSVPFAPLAGLIPENDGFESIKRVVDNYHKWIDELKVKCKLFEGSRKLAANEHIEFCERTHRRMQAGLEWIQTDQDARRAFTLANRAVLFQQIRSKQKLRLSTYNKDGSISVEGSIEDLNWKANEGGWRAFQIGFLLASLKSTVLDEDGDRETVELIFFPTGGGKTEAYQGLAAFSIFYDRVTGREVGVSVILRYTLRLLTSQQFLRASGLIAAMEVIRRRENLGGNEFSIGIWVGESVTPTSSEKALTALRKLASNPDAENPFVLTKCPWCGAQIGPIDVRHRLPKGTPRYVGYREASKSVQFFCPDQKCELRSKIPVYVIDEDIYRSRPTILIATIDKFAMLAYRPEAKQIFGLDKNGHRQFRPPNLIIQDELHLISGPLGSIAGFYESIIEDLCTDKNSEHRVKPKIVASTATIRRYSEQVKGLYGRNDVLLFPPHGLDASDSFFGRFAVEKDTGNFAQGRMYVGIHAPGLGSMQTVQVRTSSALLQAAKDIEESKRDPWFTLLMFFNSLRELGTSVSLFQSDVVDYLYSLISRKGKERKDKRNFPHVMELTSRLRKDEIPLALSKLEQSFDSHFPVDVCLASNIIEVGVDISRLSLLVVVGQPKSTSQYIQITGRVGRRWETHPGLVVTLYGSTKSRDRSHFERFQSYHQKLYAEVEPISVTPFSIAVLKRSLPAVLVAHARQISSNNLQPNPTPDAVAETAKILLDRVSVVDPKEAETLQRQITRRLKEWEDLGPTGWLFSQKDDDGRLMYRAGQWVPSEVRRVSWSVAQSMRDVDAECQTYITKQYLGELQSSFEIESSDGVSDE